MLHITVANTGFYDVTVESLGWRVGLLRRRHFFQTHPGNLQSEKLPIKLAPSERATWVFPWETYATNAGNLRDAMGGSLVRRLRSGGLRLGVHLSNGQTHYYKVGRHLINALLLPPDGGLEVACGTRARSGCRLHRQAPRYSHALQVPWYCEAMILGPVAGSPRSR